jgi:hypothetical protein
MKPLRLWPESVCEDVSVSEWHLCPTFKVTPMTCECPCTWQRVEEWRERRLAVRALWVCTIIVVCNKQRRSSPVPVPIKPRGCGNVLLFEDVVQPPCFAEERVRLRDLSLLVGVTIHLEGRLAVLVRFADIENRASAALVLFTAYDGVHHT